MDDHTLPANSTFERLRSLPPLFRGGDLTVRFQWHSKKASHYLWLWKKKGLVQALGGQSDVFANLLKSDTPDWGKALKMAMPSAVIVGIEALRQAGWTTQIPQRPAVAVRRLRSGNLFYHVEPFEVAQRGTAWFTVSKPGYSPEPRSVPILRPAWALADLLREQDWGQFGLWPDDIEWERVSEEDRSDFEAACKAYAEAGKVSSRAGIQSGNLLLP